MADYCLSCCSTVDTSKEHLTKRDIRWVSFHYVLDGQDYEDDLWTLMKPADMYKKMIDGASAHTSQVGVGEYVEHFKKILDSGKDILHLTLSSGISGTFNSACTAADLVREEYPDRKIYVEDSLCASAGFGLIMDKLADLRDQGMSLDELHAWVLEHRLEVHHWFFTSDLTFFIKGGRVTKTAGFIGTVLGICPLLNVSNTGKLEPREKIRSKKKVIARAVQKMEELAQDGLDYSDKCFISHADCYEDARAEADLIESRFPKLKGKVEIFNIGPTIGVHTGPGTVALFFWGKKRED